MKTPVVVIALNIFGWLFFVISLFGLLGVCLTIGESRGPDPEALSVGFGGLVAALLMFGLSKGIRTLWEIKFVLLEDQIQRSVAEARRLETQRSTVG
jgi:hypothetical protein